MISCYRNAFIGILYCLVLFSSTLSAQAINYNDVAVIVNMNDTTSQNIAAYFKAKRNIPDINMIPVYTSSQEEINDSLFQDLAIQIRSYIDSTNIGATLNYLVTTKGDPLKVLRDSPDVNNCNSSVESELMLLTPTYQSQIGSCKPDSVIDNGTFLTNPYYSAPTVFSSSFYNIYLVTRLDAYTEQEVFYNIDHSGPNTYANIDSVLFVFDQSPKWNGNPLNTNMAVADSILVPRGWNVLLNTDSVFVIDQKDVIGYMSWGSNDGYSQDYTQNAIPHNTWANGSIAETCVSTSGRSFMPGTTYGQSLIADLLAEGCTAAKGYVYEPFTIAIATPNILFERYTRLNPDGSPVFNLAESYFAASLMIGWMDVVVGDPKTSITTNLSLANGITENKISPLLVFPNPAGGEVFISAKTSNAGLMKLQVFDVLGKQVMQEEFSYNGNIIHTINTDSFSNGVYIVQMQSGNEIYQSKVSVVR